MSVHPLHPLPAKLVKLLMRERSKLNLAVKIDHYLARHSTYRNIGEWLDAPDNLEERRKLGQRIVEILTDGSTSLLEE